MILQRKKVILHSLEFGPLTQETILNIAQFREITLKECENKLFCLMERIGPGGEHVSDIS